jgi:transcriptional regulator with XRE-family HTH domain
MTIGQRIREFRKAKNLSQGDLEQRTGLLRCYTSRVENGYTVPTVDTLEKYARAFEVPLYRFFYEGKEPPKKLKLPPADKTKPLWGASGKEWPKLRKLAKALGRMDERKRELLIEVALRMARRNQTMR